MSYVGMMMDRAKLTIRPLPAGASAWRRRGFSARWSLLCVLGCSSATSVFGQGIEIKTSDTSTDVSRFRIPTSGGVGVDAKAWFLNARLGIGTSTPDALLTIGGPTTTAEITLKAYSESVVALHLVADADNVTETDNAYILLQQDNATSDAYIGLVGNAGFDPRNVAYTGTLANHLLIGSTAVGDGVQIGSAGAVRMTVATGGFVGIGTTSPANTLDVNGTVRVQGLRGLTFSGATTNNATFAAWPGFGAPVSWLYLSTGDTAAPAYSDLAVGKQWTNGLFYAANSDIYFVKTDHTFTGIGDTAGYAAIENSSNYNTLMILGRAGGIGGVRSVSCWDRLDIQGFSDWHGNGTQSGTIITANNGSSYKSDWPGGWGGGLATWDVCAAGVYYNVWYNASDGRQKRNIRTLEDALSRVLRLRPVSFDWKDPRLKGRHFGFVAQDVEEVLPDLVAGSEEGTKTVAGEFAPFLVRSLQELTEDLRRKRERRKALESRLAELERALYQRSSPLRVEDHGTGQALNRRFPATGTAIFFGCGR